MAVRVAYGPRDDIQNAINTGTIPAGSMIFTKEGGDSAELFFYDTKRNMKRVVSKTTFGTYEEAEAWIKKYPCVGQCFSICVDGRWGLYLVQDGGQLDFIYGEQSVIEAPTHFDFPNIGKPSRVYIAVSENAGNGYYYRWNEAASAYVRPDDEPPEVISGGSANT